MSDSDKKDVKPLGSLDALGSLLAPGSAAQEEKERLRKEQEKKEKAVARAKRAAERQSAAPKPASKPIKKQSKLAEEAPKIKRQVYLSPTTYDWIEKTHFATKRKWRKSDGRGEITESLFIEACIQLAMEREASKPGQIIKMLQTLKEN